MELRRHPSSPPSPAKSIDVLATRLGDGKLSLVFNLEGDLDRVRIPPSEQPERRDGLWRHTCFEAFLAPPEGREYFEINLSPSGAWAAYRFPGYREGMDRADVPPPIIRTISADSHFGLVAGIQLGGLPELTPWESWRVGLSAVIEADDGAISYWALAHPQGKPDFHHPDCFALELPPSA